MKLKKGTSRLVILVFGFAIKFPRVYKRYKGHRQKMFITGLLGNLNERLWYKNCENKKSFPRLYFTAPFGIFSIHQRARELTEEEFDWYSNGHKILENFKSCPMDFKKENFGFIRDKLVMIDYGS